MYRINKKITLKFRFRVTLTVKAIKYLTPFGIRYIFSICLSQQDQYQEIKK